MVQTLIALDGSPIADQVIKMVIELLAGKDGPVTLLHVVSLPRERDPSIVVVEGYEPGGEWTTAATTFALESGRVAMAPRHVVRSAQNRREKSSGVALGVASLEKLETVRQASLALLETYAQRLEQGGVRRIDLDSAISHPADVILSTAVHIGADLIVIGSRGHLNPIEPPYGSVSRVVTAHAPCPVLVVYPRQRTSALSAVAKNDGMAAQFAQARITRVGGMTEREDVERDYAWHTA